MTKLSKFTNSKNLVSTKLSKRIIRETLYRRNYQNTYFENPHGTLKFGEHKSGLIEKIGRKRPRPEPTAGWVGSRPEPAAGRAGSRPIFFFSIFYLNGGSTDLRFLLPIFICGCLIVFDDI